MASSFTSASISASAHPRLLHQGQAVSGLVMPKSISISSTRRFPSLQHAASGLRVSCAAKPETVEKVCQIVKKQLALDADKVVTGESKFQELGADSLDTVEIVMGIEEEFGIAVEEENAQSITTVQNAADLVEDLISQAA